MLFIIILLYISDIHPLLVSSCFNVIPKLGTIHPEIHCSPYLMIFFLLNFHFIKFLIKFLKVSFLFSLSQHKYHHFYSLLLALFLKYFNINFFLDLYLDYQFCHKFIGLINYFIY